MAQTHSCTYWSRSDKRRIDRYRAPTNNFRILGDACIDFKPGLNIIFGPNATGKTSVLEAIGYCLRGRSFIGSKDSDVVTFGKDTFSLHFSLSADSDVATDHIQVEWDGRKRVTLNDKAIRSAKQLVERFKLVSQNPGLIRDCDWLSLKTKGLD